MIGVDANPEAFEHARLRYGRDNLSFRRGLVEDFDEPRDAVVFLQTIEHIHEPGRLLERIASVAPVAYISTPNRLTLAGPDAEKSDNPWHLREYDVGEYRELLEPHFARVEILGLFHARKLRLTSSRSGPAGTASTAALRLTKPFYDRFIPAISATRLHAPDGRTSTARWTSSPICRCLTARSAISRSSCTATCPTSRGSGPTRSARSGCSTRSPAPTCRSSRSPSG